LPVRRDFLTRRLATDRCGLRNFQNDAAVLAAHKVISSKDYNSPEYLVLRRHGWITATGAACSADLGPAPCWDIVIRLWAWTAARLGCRHRRRFAVHQHAGGARELLGLSGIRKSRISRMLISSGVGRR
jgi:hypothetical protein